MLPRFFSEQKITGDEVELSGPEHQHLAKVMRLRAGDAVVLFDGHGKEFSATILESGRNATQLRIDSTGEVDRELNFELTLGVALPKGDRQQWLVEKCVELGVTSLTPIVTRRGVAQPGEKALKRIERWIIGASKQCRRNRLMSVTSAESVDDFFSHAKDHTVLVTHPNEENSRLLSADTLSLAKILVAVGPEGGFTDDEIETAREAGCKIVSLGPRILRIETAAIVAAATLVLGRTS